MEVALAILFAALVGGVVFMLLDGWQRKRVEPASAARVQPEAPAWTPAPVARPSIWTPDEDTSRAAWGPRVEAETRPLPPADEPDTRPLPRREPPPLWTPPPGARSGHWDEDDRYRDEDDDDRPPGLWSGWARR